jgi:hypothetical protein
VVFLFGYPGHPGLETRLKGLASGIGGDADFQIERKKVLIPAPLGAKSGPRSEGLCSGLIGAFLMLD